MKPRNILLTLAFSGALLFGLRVFALPDDAGKTSPDNAASSEEAAEIRIKLDMAAAKVRDRLGMPAMLELSDNPGMEKDIAELYQAGWFIPATVEEVEAAQKAAAATAPLEDDMKAAELAHRATCRFFIDK